MVKSLFVISLVNIIKSPHATFLLGMLILGFIVILDPTIGDTKVWRLAFVLNFLWGVFGPYILGWIRKEKTHS
ncbi:MAG TPA: hypothetical protein VJC12_03050 [Candidatus Paceibacterota bacterium]